MTKEELKDEIRVLIREFGEKETYQEQFKIAKLLRQYRTHGSCDKLFCIVRWHQHGNLWRIQRLIHANTI